MFENMETKALMEVDGGGVTGPVILNQLALRFVVWIVSRM